jgi:hypothetical protein
MKVQMASFRLSSPVEVSRCPAWASAVNVLSQKA